MSKKEEKLKIKGVSNVPLFVERWRGRFDAGIGAALYEEEGWRSHRIERKVANCETFTSALYRGLETDSAPLHKESDVLCIEWQTLRGRMAEPAREASGATENIRRREQARLAAQSEHARERFLAISQRLAEIEEELTSGVEKTGKTARRAAELTHAHVQEYLHGAAGKKKLTAGAVQYTLRPSYDYEAEYHRRHAYSERLRRQILGQFTEGITASEAGPFPEKGNPPGERTPGSETEDITGKRNLGFETQEVISYDAI